MSKYEPLSHILRARPHASWRASFAEIERVLNFKLPSSARKYPAWWSNDPQSHSQTRAWLSVGWKTAQVDIPGEKVTFTRDSRIAAKTPSLRTTSALSPSVLKVIPQWIQAELVTRAETRQQSVETVIVQVLEQGLTANKNDRLKTARKLRAMASEPVKIDLDALIRQGRATH